MLQLSRPQNRHWKADIGSITQYVSQHLADARLLTTIRAVHIVFVLNVDTTHLRLRGLQPFDIRA